MTRNLSAMGWSAVVLVAGLGSCALAQSSNQGTKKQSQPKVHPIQIPGAMLPDDDATPAAPAKTPTAATVPAEAPSAAAAPVARPAVPEDDYEPTFRVKQSALSKHVTVIAYGDQRFHDPADTAPANPKMRVALVNRIAEEKPDAVTMSGDVPYKGSDPADYAQYVTETAPWRAAHLRIYPALGNHEFAGGVEKGLANWWAAFPELQGRRWYSVALGKRISLIQLDSNSDLTPGSEQLAWLRKQLAGLDPAVDFVLISLHHPPVADIQQHIMVDHNPRPNEIALRDYLSETAPIVHENFVVIGGHIHNYERAEVAGVTYLVSGGGGARPYEVERTKDDLYTDPGFPVFHYVKFELGENELKATMYKAADPDDEKTAWQVKDRFVISKK